MDGIEEDFHGIGFDFLYNYLEVLRWEYPHNFSSVCKE